MRREGAGALCAGELLTDTQKSDTLSRPTTGFVGFVLSLKKGLYMHQFAHYAWTHMIILITTVPT